MRLPIFIVLVGILSSCSGQIEQNQDSISEQDSTSTSISEVDQYYIDHFQDSLQTQSIGSVSRGSLKNGTIIKYSGVGYQYFDTASYLGGRAFTHSNVVKSVEETFSALHNEGETRLFRVMEFSNEHGGKMWPHRTHQNGMSVDMMMPLKKDNKAYYELDDLGATHYLLDFNKQGQYEKDTSISIDFDLVAKEILYIEKSARSNGLRIKKVIFNTDLKDELFQTPNGTQLLKSGIYITRNLEKIINDLHDDHFHIDFELIP